MAISKKHFSKSADFWHMFLAQKYFVRVALKKKFSCQIADILQKLFCWSAL
jgi:hypothetical protein